MDEQQLDLAEYVDRMALVLDLPIPAAYRSGVVDNFAKIKAIAQIVNDFAIPEDIEAATVFEP
ncbi:MAG: hypothetical protein CLLPBCKN_001747 [Chroococcidiopsis cubana SAG 39.79]|jgi:hypothetical protein|uniref:DUF4089 domain-containing protein n=2 Tax=Chroococcidiopsis TaxID=54298 RepID=K9U0R3_CHRTP|nr:MULTISPECIES: DUF4089 domain-containing protein [Chroococcidiopsis]PSB42981.1 DUF4089 domain-containing protein [Cyanosarcina cf. burmensis CCALA 770]AFY88218.1 hypothetical protein Chro_2749 [Chroococcidiopsis thermalis PCC 7203]MDZ4872359.1 hypothetical protein [Chroococcidiopsis cubana SAG 39.79]RUT11290.1 hypothetical protein DSM107010_34310 [Chroococcidiopsis cubana SAG 39.79]URD53142.1 DUF4089 domain-containing protein [Chroococcidiopsis sp. CCNUC1]